MAIKNWQEYLQQQRLETQQTRKDKKLNLESQPKSKVVTGLSEENSDLWAETPSSEISSIKSGGESPLLEEESDLKQQIDQILHNFSRVEPDALKILPQQHTPDLSQKIGRGLQYLRNREGEQS